MIETAIQADRPVAGAGSAIRARGLTKRFKDLVAVDGVDLDVAPGVIFGLLGPNGAGKTTFLRMLATLTRPDAGEAVVMGHDVLRDPQGARGAISMTGQFASLDEDLTGRENLVMLARLWGFKGAAARARADDLLGAFDLADAGGKQVKAYSGGMRRRLDIAASLVVTPGVLFLDEPTTGLDPTARAGVWRLIKGLAEGGVTILLTTQYLEEADQLASRIAVIDHGRKIAEGTPRELKAQVGSGVLHVTPVDAGDLDRAEAALAAALGAAVTRSAEGGDLRVRVADAAAANRGLGALAEAGVAVADFAMGQPSLEEVFFALTGGPKGDRA